MTRDEMITEVDGEINRLEQIRGLLARSASERFVAPAATNAGGASTGRRVLSAEARKRIGLAQKRRWAKQKRESAAGSELKK